MMRLLKNIMVTQMLLLRFQMCAVVNRVAVLHLLHRKSRMPHVVTIIDEPCLSTTSCIHTSAGAITIAVRLTSKRGIAKTRRYSPPSPPLPQVRNAVCRYNQRRAKSFGGNFTHSHIRRRCHDRRSTRIETRHCQSATRETG